MLSVNDFENLFTSIKLIFDALFFYKDLNENHLFLLFFSNEEKRIFDIECNNIKNKFNSSFKDEFLNVSNNELKEFLESILELADIYKIDEKKAIKFINEIIKKLEENTIIFENEFSNDSIDSLTDSVLEMRFYNELKYPILKVDFYRDYKKIKNEAKLLIKKYCKDMSVCFEVDIGTGGYNYETNSISFNFRENNERSSVAGFKTNMTTFLHEVGHFLDNNLLRDVNKTIHNELSMLRSKLNLDLKNLLLRSIKENSNDKQKAFSQIIYDLTKNCAEKSAISDLLGGLTNNRIVDGYRHRLEYWNNEKEDKILNETVAHMFEAFASGGIRETVMESYFPCTYIYFKTFIMDKVL